MHIQSPCTQRDIRGSYQCSAAIHALLSDIPPRRRAAAVEPDRSIPSDISVDSDPAADGSRLLVHVIAPHQYCIRLF